VEGGGVVVGFDPKPRRSIVSLSLGLDGVSTGRGVIECPTVGGEAAEPLLVVRMACGPRRCSRNGPGLCRSLVVYVTADPLELLECAAQFGRACSRAAVRQIGLNLRGGRK
jgi:hypothetical protein